MSFPPVYIEEESVLPRLSLPDCSTAMVLVPVSAGVTGSIVDCRSTADLAQLAGLTGSFGWRAAEQFLLGGGRRCLAVPVNGTGATALRDGLASAAACETRFGMLLVPDAAGDVAVLAMAAEVAFDAAAVLLADAPSGCDMQAWHAFTADARWTRRSHVAAYAPWLRLAGGELVPPSGLVAGALARLEREQSIWKAPASVRLADAVPACPFAAPAWAPLVQQGLNPLRLVDGVTRIWGSRTLAAAEGAVETRYLNVRRLLLAIGRSVGDGGQWAVFEQQSEPTWARMRQQVEALLFDLWRQGALMGSTPGHGYFVRCDRSTMTEADLAEGRLVIQLGVAPVKPAEFVMLRIGLWTAGA